MSPTENSQQASPAQQSVPLAVVHVDLDGAEHIYRVWGWKFTGPEDPVFESGLPSFLDFFERNSIHATLFVIADSLENPRKRALLQEAVRRGHEIGSHSMTHPILYRLSRQEKRREIMESRDRLEQQLGVRVAGFRAPGYSIDIECLEILAEAGYAFDTSVLPTARFAERLACPLSQLQRPHRPVLGSALVELPLPDHRPSPLPFSPSYALVLGTAYFRWGLKRYRPSGLPFVLLYHLVDLADPMPRHALAGWRSRLATLSLMSAQRKLPRCQQMLDLVLANYRITTTQDLLVHLNLAGTNPSN